MIIPHSLPLRTLLTRQKGLGFMLVRRERRRSNDQSLNPLSCPALVQGLPYKLTHGLPMPALPPRVAGEWLVVPSGAAGADAARPALAERR